MSSFDSDVMESLYATAYRVSKDWWDVTGCWFDFEFVDGPYNEVDVVENGVVVGRVATFDDVRSFLEQLVTADV